MEEAGGRQRKIIVGIDNTLWHLAPELGGASTIVPAETQEQLRQALPQVQIVTMPGLGHYPSDEKPEDFLAIVDKFLAGTKPGK